MRVLAPLFARLFSRLFAPSLALLLSACANAPALLPGFQRSVHFDEQRLELQVNDGVRLLYLAPPRLDPAKPTRLLAFALPNGNSIEQTLGARLEPGLDWHYDIQHVGAQWRRLRELGSSGEENLVLVLMEARGLSWPAWRRAHPQDANARIAEVVAHLADPLPGPVRIDLMAHSGGGGLIFGLMEQAPIPPAIDRIALLDANYNFEASAGHGRRLLDWLDGDARRQLVVIAYDDRNIQIDGKPVIGPTGGTWRASHRMLDFLAPLRPMSLEEDADWLRRRSGDGRIAFFLHRNPDNKILHTRLVGEMNGVLLSALLGRPEGKTWQRFGGPRDYEAWVQPRP
ncbi:hypothetical protein [Pelomonas sp. SE-A7]|uniref:hypothetical protein n=1 Tax=Pelomonas sp. SE-A7 TaxID=3054953 RepID=UPI00259CBDB2|nr:hypothetical protein [Pelomonas sp. SE-A7]MDM4766630.1 hypothetical protein [Pelomonas sp. SE-A7]